MPDLSIHQLFSKLRQIRGMQELLEKAVLLYVLLTDADMPTWVKGIVIAALLYLIDPLDAVPDALPLIGFLDDLSVMIAALKVVSDQVKPHHKNQAKSLIKER